MPELEREKKVVGHKVEPSSRGSKGLFGYSSTVPLYPVGALVEASKDAEKHDGTILFFPRGLSARAQVLG